LPGIFLCRFQSSSDEIYIDAFNHGRQLTKADCIQHCARQYDLKEDYLTPVSPRRMFQRICRNLHQIYCSLRCPNRPRASGVTWLLSESKARSSP